MKKQEVVNELQKYLQENVIYTDEDIAMLKNFERVQLGRFTRKCCSNRTRSAIYRWFAEALPLTILHVKHENENFLKPGLRGKIKYA